MWHFNDFNRGQAEWGNELQEGRIRFYQTKCCINRLKFCLPLLHQSTCSVCQTANWTALCTSFSIHSVLMSFNCCLEDKLRLPRKKCSLLYFTHAIQWVLCCSCKASCKCESVLMTKWHFNESNGISHTYCISISHMDLARFNVEDCRE